VQVGRGSYDIYQNSLNWTNGLPVGGGLLGLGGNYPHLAQTAGGSCNY
jgi:hypothetical protein